MNSGELGKRIKEARLAKKMTQSELVGTFITRNMLSRIESGNACPSVKTLEYLARRLGLPYIRRNTGYRYTRPKCRIIDKSKTNVQKPRSPRMC